MTTNRKRQLMIVIQVLLFAAGVALCFFGYWLLGVIAFIAMLCIPAPAPNENLSSGYEKDK